MNINKNFLIFNKVFFVIFILFFIACNSIDKISKQEGVANENKSKETKDEQKITSDRQNDETSFQKSLQSNLLSQELIGILLNVKNEKVEYCFKSNKNCMDAYDSKLLFDGDILKTNENGRCVIVLFQKKNDKYEEFYKKMKENKELKLSFDAVIKSNKLEDVNDNNRIKKRGYNFKNLLYSYNKGKSEATSTRRTPHTKEWDIIKNITLSEDYPVLIWNNKDSKYQYNIYLDGQEYEKGIGTTGNQVQYKFEPEKLLELSKLKKQIKCTIKAISGADEIIKEVTIDLLDEAKSSKIKEMVDMLGNAYRDKKDLHIAMYLKDQNILVPATNALKKYLDTCTYNPSININELRPILISLYDSLHLDKMKDKIIQEFNDTLKNTK